MVLDLFGTDFKDKLFEELVSLNIKPWKKPKEEPNKQITWVPCQGTARGYWLGTSQARRVERPGKFNFNNLAKVGSISTT